MCAPAKTCMASNNVSIVMCKIQFITRTRTVCVYRNCHETIPLTACGALSFIIYSYRNILPGEMVTDIRGDREIHTSFVATSSLVHT